MSSEAKCRTKKRSLKTLQRTSLDRENLTGRPRRGLKHQLTQGSQVTPEVTPEVKKNLSSKETQASFTNTITVDDLTNPKGASKKYWEILAGKRQIALQEALDENDKLKKIIEDLKEENAAFKQMLDEANSFIEVIKEELNATDDTGIDVNDVSTADETSTLDQTQEDETNSPTEN